MHSNMNQSIDPLLHIRSSGGLPNFEIIKSVQFLPNSPLLSFIQIGFCLINGVPGTMDDKLMYIPNDDTKFLLLLIIIIG